jgi:hypothetical protein
LEGTRRLTDELTIRDGHIVYDLNGLAATAWDLHKAVPPRNGATTH